MQAGSLSSLAAKQHRATVVLPASRGTIFDRTGVQLAIGEQATTVYADPRQVRDPRAVAAAAGRIARRRRRTRSYDQLSNRKASFVYVARKADPAKAARLEKLQPRGPRLLSARSAASIRRARSPSHILGYAGLDNRGLSGLELQLDKTLAGRPGGETRTIDALGHVLDVVHARPAVDGRNVRLTIDHTIQANAEAVLRQTIAKWHAKGATAVVLDPRSGDVLAMANAPGFDANNFGSTPPAVTRNRAVTDVYEPGSTFKLVTVAGVLSDRLVTPQTTFTLPYSIHVADRVIHDAETRGTETMSVARILAQSSNVGAITLAEKLGTDAPLPWMRRFGFGSTTGIALPRREPGLRAAAGRVVRLDDRQRADRPGRRGDAGADGRGVRDDREPRRAGCSRTSSSGSTGIATAASEEAAHLSGGRSRRS